MNWYFAAGDLDFFWSEQLRVLSWLPQVFRKDVGFGISGLPSLWLDYPFRLVLKLLSSLGLSWFVIEKLLWVSVFALAIYSSLRLADYVIGTSPFTYISALIYSANTYFLLLFSGGQLGVSWAYAFTPWVLAAFMQTIDPGKQFSWRDGIANGLLFTLLVTFDVRVAYLALMIIGVYAAWNVIRSGNKQILARIGEIAVSLAIAGLIHAFWIFPMLFAGYGFLGPGDQFTNSGMLRFLSFADFSHTLAFLHPNWPENLFGKVYFLQPEFLVLPILAFASFLCMKPKDAHRFHLAFIGFVGVLGAFFAKGVNEPFGGIFEWMFIHIPGFVVFRDPTKFYVLIAVSYAMLIPYALGQLSRRIRRAQWVVLAVFILFWCFTLRGFLGNSNFKPISLTDDYRHLKDMLLSDPIDSRTLWIPKKDGFAFSSDIHPILSSAELFDNASVSAVIARADNERFIKTISDAGVKYVIVSQDPGHRMYLTDYRFDPKAREDLAATLTKTSLRRVPGFQSIAVFENDRFVMNVQVPRIVAKQQHLATIGLVISTTSLLLCCIALSFHRKKPSV